MERFELRLVYKCCSKKVKQAPNWQSNIDASKDAINMTGCNQLFQIIVVHPYKNLKLNFSGGIHRK